MVGIAIRVATLEPAASQDAGLESTPIADEAGWRRFKRRFLAEMKTPSARRDLDLLAALSHHTNLSVGCYCEDERRCHRSLLRRLLEERGADLE